VKQVATGEGFLVRKYLQIREKKAQEDRLESERFVSGG